MKLWIRKPGSIDFRGPFSQEELGSQINVGVVKSDDEVLEANGQSYNALKSSVDWVPLHTILSSDFVPDQKTLLFPSEDDHCFIVCQGQRRGPYLLEQIRMMWMNGNITADSGLEWGDLTEPVLITTIVTEPEFLCSQTPKNTSSESNPVLNGLGVLMFICGVFALIYFWLFFDTSVSVPTTTLFGQTIGGERVHNIGLMQDRQNGIIVSSIVTALGLICLILDKYVGKKQ